MSFAEIAGAQAGPAVVDTVVIVASRTHTGDSGRSVDVISRADIARSGARTIADVLAQAMDVDVSPRSSAQADVSIRGSSAEQVVILVDGVRMSDVQSAHYAMDLAVPLASVERVEILRGAGSALYGPDAIGGVINIVTRRDAPSVVGVRGGSFGTVGGSVVTSSKADGVSIVSSADYEKSDGHRDGSDYRDGQGRVSLLVPTARGLMRTNVGLGVRDFGAADFYAPYNSVERTATTTVDSRWEGGVGPWSVSLGGNTRRHQDHYVLVRGDPALYENRHESWQSGGDVTARSMAGPLALAIGAEGVHDQLSSARLGGRRESRLGAFAEGSLGSASSAEADFGVRGDRSSAYGAFFSPSLSATARLSDWLQLRTSGAGGFRAPTWTERYYIDPSNIGDPNLRPERFWTADAGARITASRLSVDVAAFRRRATNLIDWVRPAGAPSSIPWQTMNVGDATYDGLELTANLPPIAGVAYSAFGTGLKLEASPGDALVGKYALRPITRQIGLRAALARSGPLDARIDLLHAQRAGERGYVTGNARLAWARASYRITADVMNLTDAEWLDASGKIVASRGVYIGLERALP